MSDVHHAQDASDEDLLTRDLSTLPPKPHHRLIIGVGDELDSISRADKRHKIEDLKPKFSTIRVYPRFVDAEIDDYADIVKAHTKPEEWLGHISGNHPLVMTECNIDPVQRLCSILKHPYLGYSAFVPLSINSNGKHLSVMIMCHHGFGGTNARKEGGSLNSYIDHALRYEGWDIALYAHRHDRWCKTVPRIQPEYMGGTKNPSPWVRATERKVAQCGTYLRTLSQSEYPTYSEKQGYPPRPMGCLIIKFKVERFYRDHINQVRLKFVGSNE